MGFHPLALALVPKCVEGSGLAVGVRSLRMLLDSCVVRDLVANRLLVVVSFCSWTKRYRSINFLRYLQVRHLMIFQFKCTKIHHSGGINLVVMHVYPHRWRNETFSLPVCVRDTTLI